MGGSYSTYAKCVDVIDKCTTVEQLVVAEKYLLLAVRRIIKLRVLTPQSANVSILRLENLLETKRKELGLPPSKPKPPPIRYIHNGKPENN